jgi:hypothetical protein
MLLKHLNIHLYSQHNLKTYTYTCVADILLKHLHIHLYSQHILKTFTYTRAWLTCPQNICIHTYTLIMNLHTYIHTYIHTYRPKHLHNGHSPSYLRYRAFRHHSEQQNVPLLVGNCRQKHKPCRENRHSHYNCNERVLPRRPACMEHCMCACIGTLHVCIRPLCVYLYVHIGKLYVCMYWNVTCVH